MINKYNETQTWLHNNKEIRGLLINNPELPLLFSATEDANNGNYSNMISGNVKSYISYITQYNDEVIFDDEEYLKELIADDLYDENKNMEEKEFEKLIQEEFEKYVWFDAIIIILG